MGVVDRNPSSSLYNSQMPWLLMLCWTWTLEMLKWHQPWVERGCSTAVPLTLASKLPQLGLTEQIGWTGPSTKIVEAFISVHNLFQPAACMVLLPDCPILFPSTFQVHKKGLGGRDLTSSLSSCATTSCKVRSLAPHFASRENPRSGKVLFPWFPWPNHF